MPLLTQNCNTTQNVLFNSVNVTDRPTTLTNIGLPHGSTLEDGTGDLVLAKVPSLFVNYAGLNPASIIFLPELGVSGSLLPGQFFYILNSSSHNVNISYADGTAWGVLGTSRFTQFFVGPDGLTWVEQNPIIGINGVFGNNFTLKTVDIPEDTNLYFTDGRADARAVVQIAAAKNIANGIAGLDSSTKVVTSLLYTNVASGVPSLDSNIKILSSVLPFQSIGGTIAGSGTLNALNFGKLSPISSGTITIPKDSTASIDIGFYQSFFQTSSTQCGFTPEDGTVTVFTEVGYRFYGAGSPATVVKLASNQWLLTGSLKV